MTSPLVSVPFLDPGVFVQPLAAILGACGVVKVTGPLLRRARQRAYDGASAAEAVRLVISAPAGLVPDGSLATELVRALHPRRRRGFDAWRTGWPSTELRIVRRHGELAWEIVANRQIADQLEHALRTLYPGTELEPLRLGDTRGAATATGRLVAGSSWPLGEAGSAAGRVLNRLAAGLERAPDDAEVRLRLVVRPVSPEAWKRDVSPQSTSLSMARLVGGAVIDGLLLRPTAADPPGGSPAPTLSPEARTAQLRKARGVVGFDVGLVLEVAGLPADQAEALLWRLVDFTHPLGDGHQEVRWEIRRGGPVASRICCKSSDGVSSSARVG